MNMHQLQIIKERGIDWIKQRYWLVAASSLLLLLLCSVAVPTVRAAYKQAADVSITWLTGDNPEILGEISPTGKPINSLESLGERVKALEASIQDWAKQRQADVAVIQALQADYQSAVREVAATNDQLIKQGETLTEMTKSLQAGNTSQASESVSTSAQSSQTTGKLININKATATELDTLAGIGPSYAQRIIDYRTKNGPYKTVDDLENVTGIGPATVAKIKDLVTV